MMVSQPVPVSVDDLQAKLPRFTVPVVAGLLVVSLAYSVLVAASLVPWLVVWGGLFSVVFMLSVVYLLYRLVLAVERVAERQ